MITVVKYHGGGRVEIHGLSKDEKPMEVANIPVGNASLLYEMDTQAIYMFDEENGIWIEQ